MVDIVSSCSVRKKISPFFPSRFRFPTMTVDDQTSIQRFIIGSNLIRSEWTDRKYCFISFIHTACAIKIEKKSIPRTPSTRINLAFSNDTHSTPHTSTTRFHLPVFKRWMAESISYSFYFLIKKSGDQWDGFVVCVKLPRHIHLFRRRKI